MGVDLNLGKVETDLTASSENKRLRDAFYSYMERKVDIPRMRVGNVQTLETLISEECLLLAKYLRNEKKEWIPRIAELT
jgi:hypothetical protein